MLASDVFFFLIFAILCALSKLSVKLLWWLRQSLNRLASLLACVLFLDSRDSGGGFFDRLSITGSEGGQKLNMAMAL